MYDLKTEIGCTYFKDTFITENVFLLFCSEQSSFWLSKLIKKKSILIYKKLKKKTQDKLIYHFVNFGNILLSFRKLVFT